ncbi:putative ABC-class ATPase [Aequitasia blattaphilus]|uniref:ABC-ATPase domain-containing protein n=1 Tax=Aequitasia blattaphilus TaxID=2949332 RepID=A0ABT1E8W7_9FIRM|nr:ABC-ATPase domain-containing protein [Aequitasia blattaphilus]MCP1102263.1 ABC-ATPase domain-containing protein [Aequitasia blattaphilus]MCR8614903.1 ABC-ATPase domain-containing protein [Aequitasia blattaphilus]
MFQSNDLRKKLQEINRRSYPAYKGVKGSYRFDGFLLNIEHVQGDPFAAPSSLSITVAHQVNKIPEEYYGKGFEKATLSDYLLRRFKKEIGKFSYQAKGSGKSGLISISGCGQEVLQRSACEVREKDIILRFQVGFPARGRTIDSTELIKILFDYLPVCVDKSLYYRNLPQNELQETIQLARDQQVVREELKKRGLVAFIANNSILPRESGISNKPMKGGIPFVTPDSMKVVMDLPYKGEIIGMGIKKGITVIAGGGYHGKSTILKAIERGVYNHIKGDGREFVITDDTALKVRAEDGRKITDVDISLFINHLPNEKDTKSFSTLDASGSTSQAANIVEGIEAGSKLLLIDEDTSATNLMVRDELMQKVVAKDKEPITPFLERAKGLYKEEDISTILVVGSSGSFFQIADKIIQMDTYKAYDITERAKAAASEFKKDTLEESYISRTEKKRYKDFQGSTQKRKSYRGDKVVESRLKIKQWDDFSFSLGNEKIDLRYVEQIVDKEQTQTLAYVLRYIKENSNQKEQDLKKRIQEVIGELNEKGFSMFFQNDNVSSGLAYVREQEVFACINRY